MPITLITGPANSGKARAVLQALRRHIAHGEQPLLVVPTGADADGYRRELAREGPVSGVSVCLFDGLLERVARRAAAAQPSLGRPPLSAGAREQMLFALTARMQEPPGSARRLAQALGGAIAELQAADLSSSQLRATLRAQQGERRAQMLLELHESYNHNLSRHRLLDAEQRARRALDVLRQRPALWRAGARPAPVLLYGFDDLTSLQMDAVQTIGQVVDAPVTIALAYEPGRVAFAGRAWAFEELAPRAAEHVRLQPRSDYYAQGSRAALHRIERRLFEPGDGSAPEQVALLAQSGVRKAGEQLSFADAWEQEDELEDEQEPEQETAREQSPSSEIAGDEPPPQTQAVRLLRGSSPEVEAALIAAEVSALIEQGVSPGEIAIVHRSPASAADRLAQALDAEGVPHAIYRRARFGDTALGRALTGMLSCACEGLDGVPKASLGDLLAWLRAPGMLERVELVDRLERQALRGGVRDAAGARALWELDRWPLDSIDRVREAAKSGAAALLESAEDELMRLFASPRTGAAAVLDPRSDEAALALQAGLSSIAALQELARLDPGLLGGAVGVLDALRGAPLPRRHPEQRPCVALLDPFALRARRVRALFACGLQEGVFPLAASSDPILSEEMRLQLAAGGGSRLAQREDPIAAERYLLYATVSRPQERLYLSWHESGDDGVATPPSLFLDDLCDLFERDLRSECVSDCAGAEASAGPAGTKAPAGAAGARAARWERASQRLALDLSGREMWSASSLERWAACPVGWFVERLLRAEDLEPAPEPLARGSLAHVVLSDVLEALRAQAGSARISPATLPLARRLCHEALDRRGQELPLSVARERQPTARRKLEADLDRYLQHEAQQQSSLEPAHIEIAFGFPEQPESLPPLKLADGVLVRGRIDRVDVGPGGQAIVYDYKSGRTGSSHSGPRWAAGGRFQMAIYMRAVTELLGLEVIGGLYQPLAGADLRARGALVADAGIEISCVRTDLCEREQLAEIVEAACEAALGAAREAQAAQFQPRPASCGYGGGCSFPTICRCER